MWGRECVSSVVEVTLQAHAPKYSLILELDRKIRDFSVPWRLQIQCGQGAECEQTKATAVYNVVQGSECTALGSSVQVLGRFEHQTRPAFAFGE